MSSFQSEKNDFQKMYYDALQKQVILLEEKIKYQDEMNQLKLLITQHEQKIQDIAKQKDEQYGLNLKEKDIIIENLQNLVEEQSNKLIEQEQKIKIFNKNEISESRIIEQNESLDQESNKAFIQLFPQKRESLQFILQDDQDQSNQRFGTIEVCLVIDTTESMMQNKDFIIKAIREVYHQIKQSSLKIRWAVVTYKDYQENQQYRPYPQISFNEDIDTIQEFIKEQQFCGGGDFAEDLKNGLQQALNLEWQSMKKVVMILTDAPCHGFKYNQDVNDKFPDDIIEEQLDQIIKQKIYLICVGFKNQYDLTRVMFKEFKKYFQQRNYKKIDRYTIHEKATNKKEEFVDFTVYKILKDISLSLNQMKQSTYYQLIQDNKVQKFEFQLFNCECDPTRLQEYFENHNLTLGNIENFYIYEQRGEIRSCEREAQPFYQDSMKKIFKMKYSRNSGDIDIYALTSLVDGPFKSKYAAASFIKTHLIAKILYKQFQQQLNNSFSNISFSNYILLKEKNMNQNDQQEHYWIAQKYYEKDQIYQFNDCEGNLTSLEDSDYNEFLQSFSYYTYFESNCKLLVCNLKVFKNILLHPNINTHSGQYGLQDNGKDSIYNFLYQFRNFQKQYKYLDQLSITYKKE